jgi:hypothetical protein
MPPSFRLHDGFRPSGNPPSDRSNLGTPRAEESINISVDDVAAAPAPQRGGYGTLNRSVDGARPGAAPDRQYPKSANFALPVPEPMADEVEAPHSARAGTKSWSSTGGLREATFKKRPLPRDDGGGSGSALGFASVLQASEASEVASGLSALSMAQQQERRSSGTDEGSLSSRRRSVDIDSIAQAQGLDGPTSWKHEHAELPRSDPGMLRTGVVLGVAAEADEMAMAYGDSLASEREPEPHAPSHPAGSAGGGKYGGLGGGSGGGSRGRKQQYNSWSESGGIREGAFKSKGSREFTSDEVV